MISPQIAFPLSPPQSPLNELSQILKASLQTVDSIIDTNLRSQIPLIEQITKHIIYAGGKRIRPCLTLACSQLFSHPTQEAAYLAAAVEFIHTATLLHDDVIDESDLRRGKPSAHQVWGNASAILVGDMLFARAFQLMVKTNNLRVLDILSNTSAIIAEGEVLQLVEAHNLTMTEETTLKILGAKTAHLFGAACQTGSLVGNASSDQAQFLFNYGYNLGLIFQITDDILDYIGTDTTRGKTPGDDFREGKITLPVIYAYKEGDQKEKSFWERTLLEQNQTPEDFQMAKDLLFKHDAFDKTLALGKLFYNQAIESLNKSHASNHPHMPLLKQIAEECLKRDR